MAPNRNNVVSVGLLRAPHGEANRSSRTTLWSNHLAELRCIRSAPRPRSWDSISSARKGVAHRKARVRVRQCVSKRRRMCNFMWSKAVVPTTVTSA